MNELLADGPSSRLNRALVVDRQWASSVHGDIAPTRDPGLYAIWIQMVKGHTAEEAERLVVAAAAELAAHPVGAAELGKAAARMESQFWQQLGSSHGRAETVGAFEIAAGDFRALLARGAEYARVTAADVQRAAAGYLATGRALGGDRATVGRAGRAERESGAVSGVGALVSAALMVGVTPPAPSASLGSPGAIRRPGPAGSLVIVEDDHSVPLVHVIVASRSGSAADPRHREGLTNLGAEWARHGAGGRSRAQLDEALDALGGTLEVHTEQDLTRFEGEVLARNLDAYLAMVADILIRPTFDAGRICPAPARRRRGRSTRPATTTACSARASSCATSTASTPTAIPSTG